MEYLEYVAMSQCVDIERLQQPANLQRIVCVGKKFSDFAILSTNCQIRYRFRGRISLWGVRTTIILRLSDLS